MDFSVVIPTYNRSAQLRSLLDGLMRQDYDGEYEVIVVDDGSRDDTPSVLESWTRNHPDKIRAIRQGNSGPARARNRGAADSCGRWLAFVDDDCVPEATWLQALELVFESTRVAAVAGGVINREEDWVGRYINRESVIDHVRAEDGTVREFVTANAAIRADVFRSLQGFDERIRVAGGEDTELSLRLRTLNHKIAYAPEARVHHASRAGLLDYLRMIYRHGRGRWWVGKSFPEYRLAAPYLRLVWLCWPFRRWMVGDYVRYRRSQVPIVESLSYVALRYLENVVRMAGYIRGT